MNVKCPDCGQAMFIYDSDTLTCKNGHRHPTPQAQEATPVVREARPRHAAKVKQRSRVPVAAVAFGAGLAGAGVLEAFARLVS